MKIISNDNWGLKVLALILAIVIYYVLKNETAFDDPTHDRRLFQSR